MTVTVDDFWSDVTSALDRDCITHREMAALLDHIRNETIPAAEQALRAKDEKIARLEARIRELEQRHGETR
jgi:hypothetical protein